MVDVEYSYPGNSYPAETWPGTLQVTIDVSSNFNNPPHMVYRLRMTVTSSLNIDPNIFVFETVPDAAGRDADQVRFVTVATPLYMQELPLTEPSEGSGYYYRDDEIDLYYRTVDELEDARDQIVRRINLLLTGIESMTSMNNQMVVNWTFDTDEDSSAAPV